MLILATLLLGLAGGLMLLMVLSNPRVGPEGPVGAHMVTGPMAIGQAVAVGIALAVGALADTGWLRTTVAIALPGYVIALTVLPVTAMSARTRLFSVAAILGALAGCTAVLGAAHVPEADGIAVVGIVGGALVALAGLGGYGLVAAMLVQAAISSAREAAASAEREDQWRKEQAAWQLGEWQKLPPNAELSQLMMFVHAQDETVRSQCHARIAAMPDLDERMDALLRTGWAEHAISFVAHDYPRSRAPLAPALAEFLDGQFAGWESTLRSAELPHTWSGNVSHLVAVMRTTIADGGDLRAQAAKWAAMLGSIRGMGHFANELAVA